MSTKIEWTRGDDGSPGETWNPTTGCDRLSPGCDNCYALTMSARLKGMGQAKYQRDGDPRTSGPGFGLTVHPDALDAPLHWRKPRRVFVNSMSDLFHPQVPPAFIVDVFARMMLAPRHTFQVLTKRPQRMAQLLNDPKFGLELQHVIEEIDDLPGAEWSAFLGAEQRVVDGGPLLPNVHLLTSIENDRYAFRVRHLLESRWVTPVLGLSLEPLLGPLPSLDLTGIDWVIVGGESGPGARPMHPDWVRDIRDRCNALAIPFFFKQWGAWRWFLGPSDDAVQREPHAYLHWDGRVASEPEALADGGSWQGVWRLGKKAAGRELDGRTWDEMPEGID